MSDLKLITKPKTELNELYNRFETVMGNNFILIDWNMGSTCNYHCSYCDDFVNDGKIPWPDYEVAIKFAKKCIDHYATMDRKVLWNLLGGEPTVWKDFAKFFTAVKEYDPETGIRILTNGSRTLSWWKRNVDLFDEVLISYHPENADYKHCTEVANILISAGKHCTIQVCMYPPYEEKCKAALEYFSNNCMTTSLTAKSLQVTLCSSETFDYSDTMLDLIKTYRGGTTKLYKRMSDPDTNPDMFMKENISKKNKRFYGKTARFINTETGKQEFFNSANILMSSGRNSWKGWMCNIGIETLVVTTGGIVTSGSSCNHKINHGNINDPENIIFPTSGVICEYDWCSCITDVEVTKTRV